MATRTIRLMGKAYSTSGDVSLVVNFNNTEVFKGTVNTVTSDIPDGPITESEILATFTIDTNVTGDIPLTITVSGGDLHFVNLIGNYSGYESNVDENNVRTVTVQPVDYFSDMNVNDATTDGKENIVLEGDIGESQARTADVNDDATWGDWGYRVYNGVTFKCDFAVDADLVVTEVPE